MDLQHRWWLLCPFFVLCRSIRALGLRGLGLCYFQRFSRVLGCHLLFYFTFIATEARCVYFRYCAFFRNNLHCVFTWKCKFPGAPSRPQFCNRYVSDSLGAARLFRRGVVYNVLQPFLYSSRSLRRNSRSQLIIILLLYSFAQWAGSFNVWVHGALAAVALFLICLRCSLQFCFWSYASPKYFNVSSISIDPPATSKGCSGLRLVRFLVKYIVFVLFALTFNFYLPKSAGILFTWLFVYVLAMFIFVDSEMIAVSSVYKVSLVFWFRGLSFKYRGCWIERAIGLILAGSPLVSS